MQPLVQSVDGRFPVGFICILVVNHSWRTMARSRRLKNIPKPRYWRFCNVLCLWSIWAIPTYRVYRVCDMIRISIDMKCVTWRELAPDSY